MKITNIHGIPEPFVRAVQDDNYSRGDSDFSATGLIRPPQIRHLEELHKDELSTDVTDMIAALMGNSVHSTLEKYAPENALAEKRWFAEIDGVTVSGAIDLYEDGHVLDYKVTKVYSTKVGKSEWEQQLNIYAWLLRQNDMPVKSLTICVVCKDFSKMKVDRERGYPKAEVVTIDIPLWLPSAAEDFVAERVRLHSRYDVPQCTDAERWPRRNGEYIRCEKFCSVSNFCTQFQQEEV